MLTRLGWTEFTHNTDIAKDWALVGLDYKSVIGADHAWCALAIEIALKSCGLEGSNSAAAISYANWGEACDFRCGAVLPLRHPSGGHHVCVFMYWVDESNKLAACLGGNQNNAYNISVFNLSGNHLGHDEVINGPRWPKAYPKTGYVYAARGNEAKAGSTT